MALIPRHVIYHQMQTVLRSVEFTPQQRRKETKLQNIKAPWHYNEGSRYSCATLHERKKR